MPKNLFFWIIIAGVLLLAGFVVYLDGREMPKSAPTSQPTSVSTSESRLRTPEEVRRSVEELRNRPVDLSALEKFRVDEIPKAYHGAWEHRDFIIYKTNGDGTLRDKEEHLYNPLQQDGILLGLVPRQQTVINATSITETKTWYDPDTGAVKRVEVVKVITDTHRNLFAITDNRLILCTGKLAGADEFFILVKGGMRHYSYIDVPYEELLDPNCHKYPLCERLMVRR